MKKYFLLMLMALPFLAKAQDTSLFQRKYFVKGTDTLPYRMLLPDHYNARKKYPVIFLLHGAGERGNDNALQLVHGSKLFLDTANRRKFPAIVVFPQCPANSFWAAISLTEKDGKRTFEFPLNATPTKAMELLLGLVKEIPQTWKVDKKRVYVGGLSMGGMGTFELAWREPKMFAAAFPICGGGNPANAANSTGPSWWIFHGKKDDVVNPELSKQMAAALKAAGADVKLTLYPDANHNSWDPTFAEPDLLPWLFSHSKK